LDFHDGRSSDEVLVVRCYTIRNPSLRNNFMADQPKRRPLSPEDIMARALANARLAGLTVSPLGLTLARKVAYGEIAPEDAIAMLRERYQVKPSE
jgi:hypothetical protein